MAIEIFSEPKFHILDNNILVTWSIQYMSFLISGDTRTGLHRLARVLKV